MKMTFPEAVGATLGVLSLALIGWAVIVQHSDTALGLAGGVLTAAAGFFLRAKIQAPTEGK